MSRIFDDKLKYKLKIKNLRTFLAKFQTYFDNFPEGIFVIDELGNYIEANLKACVMLGYTRNSLLKKSINNLVFQNDINKFMIDFEQFDEIGEINIDLKLLKNDGKYVLVNLNIIKLPNKDRICFLTDITKKIKSEEEYRLITENLNDLIFILDKNMRIEYLNNSHSHILGYKIRKLLGLKIENIIHHNDREYVENILSNIFKMGTGTAELRLKKNNGIYIWVEFKGTVFTDLNGIKKVLIISREITKFKEIEKKLESQNKELEKLSELKSEFIRRASHELKTPLISIKGFAYLFLKKYGKEITLEMGDMIQEIVDGGNRLQSLIETLLEASRLESSQVYIKKSPYNLVLLINQCLKFVKSLSIKRNHSITIKLPEKIIININKEQMINVFTNLLSNAIKYTPPNGKIVVQNKFEKNKVIISIKDNGIGFTKEEKSKIFKQFGKIERYGYDLNLEIDGTGLGLFISKKIVEAHRGNIWVESEGRDKGSTFYISLPLN